MKAALKNILATGMLLFLGFHFTLVFNYAAPVKAGGKLGAASDFYCYPYFYQQWTVFVPAPQKHFDLMIRNGSADNHSWQAWRNITNHLLKRRKPYTALLGRETEILLMTNAVSYLSSDLEEKDQVFLTRPEWPRESEAGEFLRARGPSASESGSIIAVFAASGTACDCPVHAAQFTRPSSRG